jgi:catecholate siderophore receptor
VNKNVIFTVDATAVPPLFNQDDQQRVRGIAMGIAGRPSQKLQLMANFSVLDTELQTQNSANNGKRLTLTPPYSGSLWAMYLLPLRINVGGGVQYNDKVWVNAANTIKVPAYAVAAAVLGSSGHQASRRAAQCKQPDKPAYIRNVNNAGNRYNPGRPRSAMLTTNFSF